MEEARRGVGRPKKSDKDKVKYAYISITPETYKRFKAVCKQRKITMVRLLDEISKEYEE